MKYLKILVLSVVFIICLVFCSTTSYAKCSVVNDSSILYSNNSKEELGYISTKDENNKSFCSGKGHQVLVYKEQENNTSLGGYLAGGFVIVGLIVMAIYPAYYMYTRR